MKRFLRCVYFALCLSIALSTFANAYIDPSVMTGFIQVVAGIAVAAGAVVGVLWRRAKKKVQEKLGIDEDAGKEKEAEVEFEEDDD